MMNNKNPEKNLILSKLFKNLTKSQISWNLIVRKELSGVQLSRLLHKNISTITRNLNTMKMDNLVFVSRTEMVKNFQVKYWKLNPELLKETQLLSEGDSTSKDQLDNILKLSLGIIKTLVESAMEKENPPLELIVMLLDKKDAAKFEKKFMKFIKLFITEHQSTIISNLEELNEDNVFFFFISSQIKNSISHLS